MSMEMFLNQPLLEHAVISLFPQVTSANSPTLVPPTHVQTVASAIALTPATGARARHSSPDRPANRTSTSATSARRPARTAACASTRSAGTDASARRSTRASTARVATCRATRHPATTEAPASRREKPATNAPACQVQTLSLTFIDPAQNGGSYSSPSL